MSVCSGCSEVGEKCSTPKCEQTCESWTNIDPALIGTDAEMPFWPVNHADPECDEIKPEECSTASNYRCNSNCKITYDTSCGGCTSNADCNSPTKPICNTNTKQCVECLTNTHCIDAGITCGPPLGIYPNRYARCNNPTNKPEGPNTYTCSICGPCYTNSDCENNFCCDQDTTLPVSNRGTGQCTNQIYNKKYLCTS
ncbi:MAG: hypothetical protein PHD13_06660 [Methanocellales archaeon]|nr:hypothetical protein [Methanocellales archaeon]MDD3291551.1 hypothetical protein [Methanocellales archaeon]MDD5235840.1 hypothetical protein [Methanocellales archaeon]MDD5485333.1 hypothetical protein [Methanocellales archaeon]